MFDEKDERDIEQELNNSIETQEENVEINVKNKRKRFDDFKIKYKKNKKKYLIFMSALFAMLSMSMGSSYAYLTYVGQTANTVILDVGTLALTFQNEQNIISLTNAVPMSDEQGLLQEEEYSFDIKNNGTIPARYKITLDNICETGEGVDLCIPDEYVKVGVKEGTTEYKVVERNSNNEYIIETGSLQSNEKQNYKIKVWLAYNTPNTYNAIDNASIAYKGKLGLTYEQGKTVPSYVDTMKKLANTNQTINFKNAPSDTNGNGINILEGTENDPNPIYFYRGFDTTGKHVVDHNNVLFGGFCWKIVRTTDTGGIKIVYNGEPTNGKCKNTTGTATQLSATSAFNSSYNSPAYNGYMYGTVYPYKSGAATSGSLFGSSFTYSGGTYTLSNTTSAVDNTHHYTCNNTTGSCSTIRYYYYIKNSNNYYIELTNGKSVNDAIEEMQTNTTDSTIKTVIDNWYEANLASYEEYLEDTVWCNDRSIYQLSGWNPEGGDLTKYLYYKGYERNASTLIPSVTCPNKNDAFTVNDTTKGNGKLKHPIALLTADELTIAGSGSVGTNKSYLYTNQYWWSLSPNGFSATSATEFDLYPVGILNGSTVTDSVGVRPAVSLAPGVGFTSGDGSADAPYKIE